MSEPPSHTSVDEVHAHPRHSGFRAFDLMLALSAVMISAVSLLISVQHGKTDRQLVEANSWPMLQQHGAFSYRGEIRVFVRNAGVGPAKLESFEVLYKGKPVDSIRTLLQLCCDVAPTREAEEKVLAEGLSIYSIDGDVLRPGDENTVIRIVGSETKNTVNQKFPAASKDISYRACYCSVFDQCWMSTLSDLHPRPIERCPENVVSFNDGVF